MRASRVYILSISSTHGRRSWADALRWPSFLLVPYTPLILSTQFFTFVAILYPVSRDEPTAVVGQFPHDDGVIMLWQPDVSVDTFAIFLEIPCQNLCGSRILNKRVIYLNAPRATRNCRWTADSGPPRVRP